MTTPEYTPTVGDSVILDSKTFATVVTVNSDHRCCSLVLHGGVNCYGIDFDRLKPFNVTKAVEMYLKAEDEKGKLPEPKPGPIFMPAPPTFLEVLAKSAAELTAHGYYASAAGLLEVMSEQDENAQETWEDEEDEEE